MPSIQFQTCSESPFGHRNVPITRLVHTLRSALRRLQAFTNPLSHTRKGRQNTAQRPDTHCWCPRLCSEKQVTHTLPQRFRSSDYRANDVFLDQFLSSKCRDISALTHASRPHLVTQRHTKPETTYKAYELEQRSITANLQTQRKGLEQSASPHHASNLVKFSLENKKGIFFILGDLWPWPFKDMSRSRS